MAWFGAPLLFGQAGEAGATIVEEGSDGWFAGTMRAMVPVAISLALAANATAAQAQRVASQPQDELAVPQYANQSPAPLTLFVADRSVAMPVPWSWHQDALPAATLAGDEGAFQPPPPVRPGFDLAWLSAPTGGYVTEVAAEPAVEPEAGFVPAPAPWPVVRPAITDDSDFVPPEATAAGPEGEYAPVPPPVVPPVWLAPVEDADYLPRAAGSEGEYLPVPPPLLPPVSVPPGEEGDWATPPATPLVEDEGTYFVMPVGPTYVLLPPPSSGASEEPATPIGVDEGEFTLPVVVPWLARQGPLWDADGYPTPPPSFGLDEDTGEVVRRLTAALPLFYDPAFFVYEGDDTVAPVDEDGYQPAVNVPWRATAFLPSFWATDEYPNGAGPSPTFDDEPYRPAVWVPWRAVQRPVEGAPDEAPPPAPALSEDHYQPPIPRGLEFGLAWLSAETGGYAPEVAAVPPPDEDAFRPAPPINVRPVVLPVWDNENEYYLAPFFLDEDLDPEQLQRALPPVWKAVRPVWGFWDVDEARVTPVYPSGGQGTGRTHLFLGQIGDSRTVTSSAGALYVLSGGYGQSAGEATTLVLETPDIAPLGPQGRLRLRRIAVPFQYAAGCTVRVTPIVDYNTELDPVTVTHTDPTEVTRHVIQAKMMTACTVVRLRIEVTALAGAVEFYRPSLFFAPLSGGTTMAMGGAP